MPFTYAHLLLVSNRVELVTALNDALRELAIFDVSATNKLAHAEALLQGRTFDLVLVDVALGPGRLAELAGSIAAGAPVPVILVGWGDDLARFTAGISQGATDYLLLPLNASLLKARLWVHLQKKRLQEQAISALQAFNDVEKLADDLRLVILPLSIELSAERNLDLLVEKIVVTAMDLCQADAGTLLLGTESGELQYAVLRVRSLDIAYGGTTGMPVPFRNLPLWDEHGDPVLENVATFTAHEELTINIADVYEENGFDFSGTREFDRQNGYRTVSCLTVPLHNGTTAGVLQLRNARDPETGQVVSFGAYQQLVAEAMASQAAVALQNRHLRQREASLLRYKQELDIGRNIQRTFIPAKLPQPPGWTLRARFEPSREVAGDFYDVFALPENRYALVLADVCDKGVVAALFMALLRTMLRASVQQHYALAARYQPLPVRTSGTAGSADGFSELERAVLLESVRLVNTYIIEQHSDTHVFASLFLGMVDPRAGRLLYVNCGHVPPMLYRQDGTVSRLMPTGPAIGLLREARHRLGEAALERSSLFLAFTDGVTEARDAQGALFGEERLLSLLTTHAAGSINTLLDTIQAAVRAHTPVGEPLDDRALLALRRSPA